MSLRRHIRHFRNRLFALLIVAVLLLLAEWIAAVRDGHRPSSFLVRGIADGREVWTENQFFPTRFASPRVASPPPPVSALRARPENSLRIVILADSSALGLGPYGPAFSLSRQLEAILAARLPSRKCEVILLSAPSANSHILREIADDLSKLSPDAVLFACANDEFTGPYGPASALGGFHHSSRIARGLVLLSRTHLSRALRAALERWFPDEVDRAIWSGREPVMMKGLVPDSSPAVATARRSYERNVRAILRSARRAAPFVLACSTPVNLRSCSPFVTPYLADGSLAQLNRRDLRAAAAAEASDPDAAEELYRDILARNPRHAEALFRLASLSLSRGDPELAAALFRQACDADQMRLRAHSDFNAILERLSEDADPRVFFFDAEEVLAAATPSGVPGNEFFLDHVHLDFDGNYRLATAIADALRDIGAVPPDEPGASTPAEAELASLLLYSPWGQLDELSAAVNEWIHAPFQPLSSQPAAIDRLLAVKTALDGKIAALDPDTTRAIYARRLAERPDDPWLAAAAAVHFLDAADFPRAMDAAAAALRFWPDRLDVRAVLVLASILRHDLSAETRAALATNPDLPNPAAFTVLSNAVAAASADVKSAAADASKAEFALRESLNASLLSWALSLHLESAPLTASYPVAVLRSIQAGNADLATASAAAEETARLLQEAEAVCGPLETERDRVAALRDRAEAELDDSRKALEAARRSVSDPAALVALIRADSMAQSHINATEAALLLASRKLDAATLARSAAADADAEAQAALARARKNLSGHVRSLRQAYFEDHFRKPSADGESDVPQTVSLWGPPPPQDLYEAWTSAADREAADRKILEAAQTDLDALVDKHESIRHQIILELATAIRNEHLPLLLGSVANPSPLDVDCAHFIARSLIARNAPDLALPWLQYALDRDPGNADAAQTLAQLYHNLGRTDDAIEVLRNALELLPSNPVLWEDLGTLLCLSGDWGRANDAYERAEAIAPYRFDHLLKWARALVSLKEYRRALTPLRLYADAVPDDPAAAALFAELEDKFPDGLPAPPSAQKSSKPSILDSL